MTTSRRVPVAVVGANGYTGGELLRLLGRHPHVEVVAATSRSAAGTPLTELFPQLLPWMATLPARFEDLDPAAVAARAEVAFTCLPHGSATAWVRALRAHGTLVVDLSADYRYADAAVYARAYGEHDDPEGLAVAVYGLTEWRRAAVATASLIANPGCYPTAVLLATLPLVSAGLVAGTVIADCQSGTSGAGRTPKPTTIHAEVAENLSAYGLPTHRHESEMRHQLERLGGRAVDLVFTPHLAPVARGILATVHVPLAEELPEARLRELLAERYAAEPFVHILPPGATPRTTAVRGSNHVQVALFRRRPDLATLLVALDNLVKGAAGQAVQNLNVRMGWPETTGLEGIGLAP